MAHGLGGMLICLGDELTRTRDGQFVVGRRVDAAEAARWSAADHAKAAREAFAAFAACYRLA